MAEVSSTLLIGTYDLGRQPFGLASPAAWLRHAGQHVDTCDLSRERLDEGSVRRASTIAFYLPMHTATRLALPVIDRVRALNPGALICAYGLYASLNEPLLRARGVARVLGPEAEAALVSVATGGDDRATSGTKALPKLAFVTPDRTGLPSLARYATLQMPDGTRRTVGATDATRGCKHRCRHCPIVPIYDGHFRVVPVDVVLADVEQQVAAGAEHITFGDPDFFNGPGHARRIIELLHARHPQVTYDVTIKVEHLLAERALVPLLARTGCLFVTSAVESVDNEILDKLQKRHTRQDFFEVVALCRDTGLTLAPTFVAFTPWTTRAGYIDLLETIAGLGLIGAVAPVQWGLRLLITQGSRLLELDDVRARIGPFDAATLTYPWTHADADVDRLQGEIMRLVGVKLTRSRDEIFAAAWAAAHEVADVAMPQPGDGPLPRAAIPYLNEPWYC
jgi:radical SAM superfamily enzyme YgiQ (UPF0313 family)